MSTTKDYKDFILKKLNLLDNITYKPMMGEFLLYYNGILFGGIYDNRFLLKRVEGNKKYHLQEVSPYEGAKEMYFVGDVTNQEILKEMIINTCKDLK